MSKRNTIIKKGEVILFSSGDDFDGEFALGKEE